ncbi:hypothetical protein NDU88_004374 [Pleurodeles waltl]|uniref:Uncharacterized protein n=1 Tax=Pleurodeles waltl TaxID=8319 RepID=A0AAV7WVH3_PLEWA|nr:hypothetical protein NDU88_004374 [Pleurodeles waltl]
MQNKASQRTKRHWVGDKAGSLSATRDQGIHSTTKDVGACCGPRENCVLQGAIDSKEQISLDMFDNSEKGFDEFVFDTEEDPDALGILDDDLEGTSSNKPIKDLWGNEMFTLDSIKHPCSSEWRTLTHVVRFIKQCVKTPLERQQRNLMRAESHRPVINGMACQTPNLDPELITLLFKSGKDPRKGL